MCRVLGLGFKFFGYLGLGLVWVVIESVGNFEKASLGQFLCFKFLIRFSLKKNLYPNIKKNFLCFKLSYSIFARDLQTGLFVI